MQKKRFIPAEDKFRGADALRYLAGNIPEASLILPMLAKLFQEARSDSLSRSMVALCKTPMLSALALIGNVRCMGAFHCRECSESGVERHGPSHTRQDMLSMEYQTLACITSMMGM